MITINVILLIVLAIETIYIAKDVVKNLNKVLKFYRFTRKLNAIALSVNKAKVLAEQGKHNACLQELDTACAQITRVTHAYVSLYKRGTHND